jgi:transcriptional regulator with XRE-family HTH domain
LDPAIAFGHVLRKARKNAKLSQEELALQAGVERNFVSLIERGVNQPTVRVIFKLSKALKLLPSELIFRTEHETNCDTSLEAPEP